MPTETFDTPGTYEWPVPPGVSEVDADLEGAQGAEGPNGTPGGEGGQTSGTIPVTPGETLHLLVGAAGDNSSVDGSRGVGWNDEAPGPDGGDSTDIRKGGDTLADRVLVAGAGGGTGAFGTDDVPGGDGGGEQGQDGGTTSGDDRRGRGGTQEAGGEGGAMGGEDGSLGQGGDGQEAAGETSGGGGGGYYGGGGSDGSFTLGSGGAGGGSGYVDDSVVSAGTTSTGGSTGDGSVTLTYEQTLPDGLEVVAERDAEIDLEWAPNEESDQTIYRATEPGVDPSSATDVTTVGSGVGSYTDTGLTNGRTYYYVVEGGTTTSNEASGTTTLPATPVDAVQASGLRELTIAYDVVDNNPDGTLTVHRGDGESFAADLEAGAVVDDTNLLDGREYSYTLERDTGDATATGGSGSGLTSLPPAEGLAVDAVDGRFATLSWSDPSNNTDHYEVLLREGGTSAWTTDDSNVAGVGEGETQSYETSELLDGQRYEASVRTVSADADRAVHDPFFDVTITDATFVED